MTDDPTNDSPDPIVGSDPQAPPPIELEPLQTSPPLARPASTLRTAPPPIPANPLHLCPSCQYILTGLTSRTCPECGRPFTLEDARAEAREQAPESQSDYRAMRWQHPKALIGLGLAFLSIIIASVFPAGPIVLILVFIMLLCAPAALFFLTMYADRPWLDSIYHIGLAIATATIILCLILP